MKPVKYKQDEVLEIIWDDTTSYMGWRTLANLKKAELSHCKSIGYFQHQNKNSITIAKCVADDSDVLDCQSVHRGCIKKIKRLRKK